MANKHRYSIIPPSAVFQESWPQSGNITQGKYGALSVGGWTSGNEGFIQQTFLGASIRSFNVSAGFGDSTSTMGIELVNDEFNKSDGSGLGRGDDPYHSGNGDGFNPPVVGSPVFFKFGKNHADTEQAFRRTFDETYLPPGKDTKEMPNDPFPMVNLPLPVTTHEQGYYLLEKDIPNGVATWIDKSALLDPTTKWRGFGHFAFGGILQSYTENRSTQGNPLYSVKIADPREILSNTELLLNNYQGTTFNNKNLYNIYGFLEYDTGDELLSELESKCDYKEVLTKFIATDGTVSYSGIDIYAFPSGVETELNSKGEKVKHSGIFPITGQGFSRRSDKGIPWYRVEHALNALFSYKSGGLPKEYEDAGFGGTVDFRGYNYVVDWGGIPTHEIPYTYYLEFDQINMLDLAQELCDVLSRDLYISLLPVIDHPACAQLYKKNAEVIKKANAAPEDIDPVTGNPTGTSSEKSLILGSGLVAGIIRIDTIDKKDQPVYGAIKKYLDDLESQKIFVENRDVGFEVSNVTTDRFIVGAQEVDMYYFNTLRDRDNYPLRLRDTGSPKGEQMYEQLQHDKWTLQTCQNQQVLPFYGFIGDEAVTIPRGFGSYQQIMLDARSLDAHGVGAYYVTTEMELRAASVSFKAWTDFLLGYNELYIQELTENQAFYAELSINMTEEVQGVNDQLDEDSPIKEQLDDLTGRVFGVSVPRSVWNSGKNDEEEDIMEDNPTFDPNQAESETNPRQIPTGETTGGPFFGKMGDDGYPASPCNPPYGYPLYYKRAEKIGLPQAGLTQLTQSITTIMTNVENLESKVTSDRQRFSIDRGNARKSIKQIEALIAQLLETKEKGESETPRTDEKVKILRERIKQIEDDLIKQKADLDKLKENTKLQIAQMKTVVKGQAGLIKNISRYQRDNLQNAKKVFNFVKKVADDNLGKKFLVKIPRACNVNFNRSTVKTKDDRPWDVVKGPFGFPPEPINAYPGYKEDEEFKTLMKMFKEDAKKAERNGVTANESDYANDWPQRAGVHWHYLDVDTMGMAALTRGAGNSSGIPKGSGYTYGALKTNYNPMLEKWEFNYQPEPQGGFFNYAIYDKNLSTLEADISGVSKTKLPRAVRDILAPKLLDKLVTNGNRIRCYVRYDHSQHLDFSNLNPNDVEQQSIDKDGNIIPDVMETLPNLKPDQAASMDMIQARVDDDKLLERQKPSVAFVKCEIDEKFYMAPKTVMGEARVFAEDFSVNLAPTPYEIVYVPSGDEGCKVPKQVRKRPVPSFGVPAKNVPASGTAAEGAQPDPNTGEVPEDPKYNENGKGVLAGGLLSDSERKKWDDYDRTFSKTYKEFIVETNTKSLDPKHVYALVTLPGKVMPTVDSRYVDGPMKALNGASIANALTEDVVKIKEFEKPGFPKSPVDPDEAVDCNKLPSGVEFKFDDIIRAQQAVKDSQKGISLSNNGENSIMAFTSPSPVYPDLFALPLLSLERCYGPWLSSALDMRMLGGPKVKYSDIGGKVEFIKDEKLAPWNFAGYQLMNQSAKLKTKFSNSLLLFTERGSFSYADAPLDVSLARALREKGPLVTSISVDVGQAIKTSVKLDLYTSQFGKLQKQKEIAIAQISRERQKIIDQNNLLERRGIGKGAANMNMLGTLLENGGQKLLDAAKAGNEIFTELEKGNEVAASMITISATPTDQEYTDGTKETTEDFEGSMQSNRSLQEKSQLFTDERQLEEAKDKTAGAYIADMYKGISNSPDNKYFASRRTPNRKQTDRRTMG